MTEKLRVWVLLALLCLQVYGLYTVLVGLVGVKKEYVEVTPVPIGILNDALNTSLEFYRSSIDKIALVVIDAMRVDFLSDEAMPYISNMLDEGYGCSFLSNVKPPTVTLPRIKALVTGDISTYWDIIENFQSQKLSQDNIISHAVKDLNKKVVFYGDETWMTLFPTGFIRAEGVNSFYVTDFTDVDRNVTRHLRRELHKPKDWDMIILHYLGLDHIGHVHGPESSLIPDKLREMDDVVKKLHEFFSTVGSRSVVIICGDHGMANIGGHGGNSYHEVTTPLLVLSTEKMRKCYQKNWRNMSDVSSVEQIDIATTISVMWGMMLPAASTGKVISSLFEHLPLPQLLFIMRYNAVQLLKFFDLSESSYLSQLNEIGKRHSTYVHERVEGEQLLKSYQDILQRMSKSASDQLGEQNILQLVSGIVLCFQSTIMFTLEWEWKIQLTAKIFGLLTIAFSMIFVFVNLLSYIHFVILINILFITANIKITNCSSSVLKQEPRHFYLEFTHYATSLFLFSSSFIEEEHYLRYYFWSTGILTFLLISSEIRTSDETRVIQVFLKSMFLLMLHRIGAAWNQTGQKWSHFKDLVDTFRKFELLNFVVFFSMVPLCFLRRRHLDSISILAIAGVISFKTNPGLLSSIYVPYFGNDIHVILIMTILYMIRHVRKNGIEVCINVWIILALLLQKYENMPLVTIVLVQTVTMTGLLHELLPRATKSNLHSRGILILWFTYAAYFYQGNSNNIASIDVNAGYIGLTSYNEVIVGLLIFCNTFSLPVLILLANFGKAHEIEKSLYSQNNALTFFSTLCLSNSVAVSIYSVVIFIFRHHLFIWSVFAPKLLFMTGFSIFYVIITLIYTIILHIY